MWLVALAAIARWRRRWDGWRPGGARVQSVRDPRRRRATAGRRSIRSTCSPLPGVHADRLGSCEVRFPRRVPLRWPIIAGVCVAMLFAGLQGLYEPVPSTLSPHGSGRESLAVRPHPARLVIVLPVDNPVLETASDNDYTSRSCQPTPARRSWLDEGNIAQVEPGSPTSVTALLHRGQPQHARQR